ncbi:MAG: hypothetical protein U0326_08220 [Polyangiales bacterium]
MTTELRALALALAALASAACSNNTCSPGEQRACTRTLDGGFMQGGYQACGGTATWSSCVPVGACSTSMASTPLYGRCDADEQCGPMGCAVCGHYTGVTNPEGASVCFAYCQSDGDCAPNSAATGVTPRCVLGQCTLLCRAGSVCPRDSRCLSWATAEIAAVYPGFTGACE